MGQRSQIYISLPNIGKSWAKRIQIDSKKKWRDNLPAFVKNQEVYEKWKQMYGTKDTIIVAYHHQWLYGRSFSLMASQILFAVKNFHEDTYGYNNILHEKCDIEDPNDVVEWIKNFMQNLYDFELGKYSRIGIEHLTLLNEEHIEERDLIYSKDFTIGDNNDGVLVMDFTLKNPKYCFINIGGDSTVNKLKLLVPVHVSTYLKAYYPENEIDCSEDELQRIIEDEKPIMFNENTIINQKFLNRFDDFDTLSVEELINIFPSLKGELNKHNKNETQNSIMKPDNVLIPV